MSCDEWNVNQQLTKGSQEMILILFTNLRVGPTRECAVYDVNRGAIFEEIILRIDEKDVGPDH